MLVTYIIRILLVLLDLELSMIINIEFYHHQHSKIMMVIFFIND